MINSQSRSTLRQSVDWSLIEYIQWALKQTNETPEAVQLGMNYSIILTSAVFFEANIFSFLELMSRGVNSFDLNSPVVNNISQRFVNDTYKATGLKSYSEIFETLTNLKLPSVLEHDWEHLDNLFTLRNHLVHGRSRILELEIINSSSITSSQLSSLDKIESFFVKKKLMQKKEKHQIHLRDYISSDIAKWAWNTSSNSILKIAETRKGESRYLFEYLNSIEGFSFIVDKA